MRKIFRIGTRGSLLALAQSSQVQRNLRKKFPGCAFRLVIVRTAGDQFQGTQLFKTNDIGVFTKALEDKLLARRIDIAVHSLKDLPTELPKGLRLGAFPKRLDPRDVLISKKRWSIHTLPNGARVGTGSPRRMRQLFLLRPDLEIGALRGNLDTRIRRVIREQRYDAIVVARAGLLRVKKYLKYAKTISSKDLLPAVGQAALGLEIRSDDQEALKVVSRLNHAATEKEVGAEREFLKVLGGGCRVPVGVFSKVRKGKIYLKAAVFSSKSSKNIGGQISAKAERYEAAGRALALRLLGKGAGRFLDEARNG